MVEDLDRALEYRNKNKMLINQPGKTKSLEHVRT